MSADMVLRPGELVDITIRGARVHDSTKSWPHERQVAYLVDVWLDLREATQEATRATPAEWPPVYGDMWRDAHGELWTMGRDISGIDGGTRPRFECLDHSVRGIWDKNGVLAERGPMTLVHREPVDATADEDGAS